MKKLIIKSSEKFPKIILNPDKNIYEISGHSIPEDVIKAYEPVIKWINENVGKIKNKMVLNFKLDYLNSNSTKMIFDILTMLDKFYQSGIKISINWFYEDDDEDIKDEGELFASLFKLPFKLIPIDTEEE